MHYPPARACDQADDYFGTTVADPYRWMEDIDSAELLAWIEAQNALTRTVIDQVPGREQMLERLTSLMDMERFSLPERAGDRYFFSYNSGLQDQDVLMWQVGLDGEPQVLLDPNTLSEDGTVSVNAWSVSDDGLLLAYAVSDGGSDWMHWQVRDVDTGPDYKDLDDLVEWSKFCGASWARDGSGFYYSGYEPPTDGEELKGVNHFHTAYFHRIGTPQSEDLVVYDRPDDPELLTWALATDDGDFLILEASQGSNPNNDLVVRRLADDSEVTLSSPGPAQYRVVGNDGDTFWLYTTHDAAKGKVVAVELDQPGSWRTVLAEATHSLESASLINDQLIACYLVDARSTVEIHGRDGGLLHELTLPAIGTAAGFLGKREDTETFFWFTNFVTPAGVHRLDLTTRTSSPYKVSSLSFDPADYVTEQAFVTSADGTLVPAFVSRRKDVLPNGEQPTLLYGYGGFNVSLTPNFTSARLLWMERGGVFVQACLRGGGEYGESWHEAGTKLHKQNVFNDFIACAEWLVAQGWTRADRLVIHGGSNGGLLVAACELQRPDLFGAVLAEVGVMDMMRFDQFTVGWGWKSDYGAPSENAEESAALLGYSPLHNVTAGTRYPATLISTGDHDDRVFPAHSFKYAAAIQAGQDPAGPPVLLRVEQRAGHGMGMPLSKRLEVTVDQYLFALHQIGAL